MTTGQIDEFMRNVRWKTMLYISFTGASLLLAGAGMYYGLKGDIRESTYMSTMHYLSLDKKIDSLHLIDRDDIRSVKDDIQRINQKLK